MQPPPRKVKAVLLLFHCFCLFFLSSAFNFESNISFVTCVSHMKGDTRIGFCVDLFKGCIFSFILYGRKHLSAGIQNVFGPILWIHLRHRHSSRSGCWIKFLSVTYKRQLSYSVWDYRHSVRSDLHIISFSASSSISDFTVYDENPS